MSAAGASGARSNRRSFGAWLTARPWVRRWLLVVAGLCGLAGLVLEYGTHAQPSDLVVVRSLSAVAVTLFLIEQALAALAIRPRRRWLRERWPTLVLACLLVAEIVLLLAFGRGHRMTAFLHRLSLESVTRAYLVVAQFYVLGRLAVLLPHLHRRFVAVRIRPAVAFGLIYIGLIVCGAALLLLPRATPPAAPIGPLAALFTSTSAVCVTGLIVRDTATEFTRVGQVIILILIQLGGLGIMSLTAWLSLLLGRGIGIRENSLLREVFQVPLWSEVGQLLRFIVAMTLVVESFGAVLLYVGLADVVTEPGTRAFVAVFHAVSAFCNAGFSTFSDSLVGFADHGLAVGTIAGLLIVGGLGFTVVAQLLVFGSDRLRGRRGRRLGLQTRLVLVMTLVLLVGGTAVFVAVGGGDAWGRGGACLANAFFQSATCRTAGFNTVDLTRLGAPILFTMIFLMFIGGAPGSTAGGIKVTTLTVIWANARALQQGFAQVRLGDREIDPKAVNRAFIVVTGAFVASAAGVFVLLLSEGRDFMTVAFEVTSALGTVGLSLGLTPELSTVGRCVVIALMFVGRLGPLTLAYGLTPASREPRVRRPRADVMIG